MKHILIVSQYFYPEPFRINDIAKEFVKRGYKVTVLTGIPNYPEGKFYKGYSWFKKRKETWNGIDIIRAPIISRGKSKIRLALNYYSFKWFANVSRKLKIDVVFTFEVSPIIQGLVGIKIAKKLKVPHYIYIQDLWPENLEVIAGIHNKTILNHYLKMSKTIYDNSKIVFASSPSFVEVIKERTKTKVIYLPQYSEDIIFKDINDGRLIKEKRFKIVFAGNIGKAQGLDILIEASKKLDDVCFVIIGDGRYKETFIKNIEPVKDKFLIIERQNSEDIPSYLKLCDVAFLSFINNPIFNKTIPAKLQTYLACSMPIIGSVSGESKRIIEDAKCGYCSNIGDIDGLVENIDKIRKVNLTELGKNALKYSKENFDKNKIIDDLLKTMF